jgi:hypothetical protein
LLSFSFVANLFNKYPKLDLPTEQVTEPGIVIEETREEKTYRELQKFFLGYLLNIKFRCSHGVCFNYS